MQKFVGLSFILLVSIVGGLCGQGFDARSAALGDAVGAWSQETAALYNNPATIAQLRRHQFSASYGFINPTVEDAEQVLDDESLGAGLALGKWGNVALGYRTFAKAEQVHEQLLSFGMAKEAGARWSFGAAVHYADRTLQTHIPQLEELRSPITVNVGALYRIYPAWQTGFSYDGVNSAARGIVIQQPGTLRWAMAYEWRGFVGLSQVNAVPAPQTNGRDFEYAVAAEKWTLSSDFAKADWALRCGFVTRSDEQMRWSAGGAFHRNNVELSYAIFAPFHDLSKSQASHKVSLTYRFGALQSEQEWKGAFSKKVGLRNLVESSVQKKQAAAQNGQMNARVKKALLQIRYHQKQIRLRQGQVEQASYQLSHPGVRSLKDIYDEILGRYWQLKDRGFPLKLRAAYLTALVEGLKNKNVSAQRAQKELEQVQAEYSRMESGFDQDWKQYLQNLVDAPETVRRLEKLEKIIADYGESGIDLFHVENELANLK